MIGSQRLVQLRSDDRGSIHCAGYLLMATILGIGMIVGIATLRDQVVQEFGDIADSLQSLDQSYRFTLGDREYRFDDEETDSIQQTNGEAPAGIQIHEQPTDETSDQQGGQQP